MYSFRRKIIVSVPATVLPVSLETVKSHLRVDTDDEDQLLVDYIKAAVDDLQRDLSRYLLNTTLIEYYDAWPLDYFNVWTVGRGPLSSVTSIKYLDSSGVEQTYTASYYQVDTKTDPGRILYTTTGQSPQNDTDRVNNVYVEYVAGYGSTAASVPVALRDVLLRMVVPRYERRGLNDEEQRLLQMAYRHYAWSW